MVKEKNKRKITVFIASPGDLSAERKQFRDAIRQLNAGFADGANVEFEDLGWEDTLATTGPRNQSVINAEIDRCDVFILVMHRRWGQKAPDAKPYSSYTEEEFHRALERWRKEKNPEIFVFFKRIDAEQEADAGPQLQKVLAFKQELEETRQVLYRYIDDSDQAFLNEVDQHLRAYAKGELSTVDTTRDAVILPLLAIDEVNKAKEETRLQAQLAEAESRKTDAAHLKIEELQLESAEDATRFAKEGFVERARQKFVGLITDTSNIRILYLAYNFFNQTGDLNSATDVLEKLLVLSGDDMQSLDIATTHRSLGYLYQTRGDFDQAKTMYEKSVTMNEVLDHKEGMSIGYDKLGFLYQTRGDYDRAEGMYEKSLAIDEALGNKAGMARGYGSLGYLYQTRGDLDRAEAMHKKSLAINEELGNKAGMARDYGNFGNLYNMQGYLDQAEVMCEKSLAIHEVLNNKVGMADQYGNLGILYQARGDLDQAEAMYEKSLVIDEELGRKEGMANQYGNLGNLYLIRSDYDRAETMYKKSLAIDEAVGRKGCMAISYGNLGNLYKNRGDFDQAEVMYKKSLKLFESLNSPQSEKVKQMLLNLLNSRK